MDGSGFVERCGIDGRGLWLEWGFDVLGHHAGRDILHRLLAFGRCFDGLRSKPHHPCLMDPAVFADVVLPKHLNAGAKVFGQLFHEVGGCHLVVREMIPHVGDHDASKIPGGDPGVGDELPQGGGDLVCDSVGLHRLPLGLRALCRPDPKALGLGIGLQQRPENLMTDAHALNDAATKPSACSPALGKSTAVQPLDGEQHKDSFCQKFFLSVAGSSMDHFGAA